MPIIGNPFGALMIIRGDWSSVIPYYLGDVAARGNVLYVALNYSLDDPPPSGNWQVFGQVGPAGATGSTGPTGPTGPSGGLYAAYVNVQDRKTAGTSPINITSGGWRTRDLNTVVADTGSVASVASNQITLLAGTYVARILCSQLGGDQGQARLRNITDSTTIASSPAMYNDNAQSASAIFPIATRFTISGTKVLEVQQQVAVTRAAGSAGNFGEPEVYTIVELWKE